MPVEEVLQKMSDEIGDDDALKFLDENYPKLSMGSKSLVSAERYLRCRQRLKRRTTASIRAALSTPFKVSDFQSLKKLDYWRLHGFQPPLIIVGKPGCGKTQYVKALATENGWKIHIVNHRESLKALTDSHDAIFFDDMSFEDVDAAAFLSFLETNDDKDLRVLHSSILKRKGLVVVFAFTMDAFLKLKKHLNKDQYSRRCLVVILPDDFIINVNNQTITIHNHIYNNPETLKANQQAIIDVEK